MDDHLVYTTPNKPPPKINVISKTVLQITLAAKWLVKLSITSPKQQRRPMPSLMSISSTVCIAQCSAPRNKKLFENHRYCSDILTDSALYIMSDSTFSCLTWHTHVWLGALMSDLALLCLTRQTYVWLGAFMSDLALSCLTWRSNV